MVTPDTYLQNKKKKRKKRRKPRPTTPKVTPDTTLAQKRPRYHKRVRRAASRPERKPTGVLSTAERAKASRTTRRRASTPGTREYRASERRLRKRARDVGVPTRGPLGRTPSSVLRQQVRTAEENRRAVQRARAQARSESRAPGILERGLIGSAIFELTGEDVSPSVRRALWGTENPSAGQLALGAIPGLGGTRTAVRGASTVARGAGEALRGLGGKNLAKEAAEQAAKEGVEQAGKAAKGTISQRLAAKLQTTIGPTKHSPTRALRDAIRKARGKQPLGPKPRADAGFATTGALATLTAGGTAAVALGERAEGPAGFAKGVATPEGLVNTGKGVLYTLPGLIGSLAEGGEAVYDAVVHQDLDKMEELAEMAVDDFVTRWKPIVEGDFEEAEKIGREYGLTPFAYDALIFAPAAGVPLKSAAASGRLGKGLQEFATRDRPGILKQPGRGPEKQELSRSIFGVAGQRMTDRLRQRVTESRAARGGKGSSIASEALITGNVVPLRKRQVISPWLKEAGRRRLRWRNQMHRVVYQGLLKDAYHKLNEKQRDFALNFAFSLGIRAGHEAPELVDEVIEARSRQIVAEREERITRAFNDAMYDREEGWREMDPAQVRQLRQQDPAGQTPAGAVLRQVEEDVLPPDSWDELEVLKVLREHKDEIFNENLAEFVDKHISTMEELGKLDPGFPDENALQRQYAKQAAFLKAELELQAKAYRELAEKVPEGFQRKTFEIQARALERRAKGMDRLPEDQVPGEPLSESLRRAAVSKRRKRELKEARRKAKEERGYTRAARRKDQEEYNPSAASISQRTFYHGAPGPAHRGLTPDELTGEATDPLNLFGPGVYLTSKSGIARGYAGLAKGEERYPGPEPVIYRAKLKVKDSEVLDLEDVFTRDSPMYEALMQMADELDGNSEWAIGPRFVGESNFFRELVDEMADAEQPPTIKKAYQTFFNNIYNRLREELYNADEPLDSALEQAQHEFAAYKAGVSYALRERGIKVMTHEGGKWTNHRKHQVVIAIDPSDFWNYGGTNPVKEFVNRKEKGQRLFDDPEVEERWGDIPETTRRIREKSEDGDVPLEPIEDWIARMTHEIELLGWDQIMKKPGYFPSQFRRRSKFSAFALGGRKATAAAKKWQGELFKRGIEDPRLAVLLQGAAENIKRFHNWNLMVRAIEDLSFPWSRGDGKGRSIPELLEYMAKQGISEEDVVFMDPARVRKNLDNFDPHEPTRLINESENREHSPETVGARGDSMSESILKQVTLRPDEYRNNPGEFEGTTGWFAIPKQHADEIISAYSDIPGGRLLDIAMNKQSRFLLASLNFPWLQFQIMSNAMLAGIVGGAGPVAWVQAASWWRNLDEETRIAVEPYIGDGHFSTEQQLPRMGSKGGSNALVSAYKGLRDTAGGKVLWASERHMVRGRDLNPLNVMFALDHKQNNFFRRAVLYKEVKRQAWERMGENMSKSAYLQTRLMNILDRGPEDQMRAILRDRDLLEDHAQTVADVLGDYNTFSSFERKFLKRHVMFYGYMRFSLRLAFFTLPMRHPVMAGILYQMSRLNTEEVIELLGGDELPYALGRIYWDQGRQFIDPQRGNPLLNAFTEMGIRGEPIAVLGLFPPMYASMVGAITGVDPFTGQAATVDGETVPRRFLGIGPEDMAEIAIRQGLRMFYPYRVYEEWEEQGRPTSADSIALPFGLAEPNFKEYVRPDVVRGIRQSRRAFREQNPNEAEFLINELFPGFIPRPSRDRRVARTLREREEEERARIEGRDLGGPEGGSVYGSPTRRRSIYGSSSSRSSIYR